MGAALDPADPPFFQSRGAPQKSRFLVRANYDIPHLGPPVVSSPLYILLRLLYEPWTCVRLFSSVGPGARSFHYAISGPGARTFHHKISGYGVPSLFILNKSRVSLEAPRIIWERPWTPRTLLFFNPAGRPRSPVSFYGPIMKYHTWAPPVVSSPLYILLRLLYEPWTCVRLFS